MDIESQRLRRAAAAYFFFFLLLSSRACTAGGVTPASSHCPFNLSKKLLGLLKDRVFLLRIHVLSSSVSRKVGRWVCESSLYFLFSAGWWGSPEFHASAGNIWSLQDQLVIISGDKDELGG
ncbi:hypothetical protein SAY87_028253 [Trapa incisa]|uniref:Uncharacterized protein n=1 Tax=Trapa incisa TaxID=236973 RepID=A0AAN7KXI0_9MYRT|nr:hypothetical protein SAY87_028253 [Trapa incisa]